jgi:hypothetical protein
MIRSLVIPTIGVTVEKLSALQADFNYNLGRTLMLSDKNLKASSDVSGYRFKF